MSDAREHEPRDADEHNRDVDWTIDLDAPPPEPRADARLAIVAEVVRATQAQLASIASTMSVMEGVIRDGAVQGLTVDEICVQASLDRATVERVLDGGALFTIASDPRQS